MTRRRRCVLYTREIMLATLLTLLIAGLAACGAPAGQSPTLEPTQVYPTRVPVQPTGVQPTAVAVQPTTAPALAPTQPPPTPIPPTPTRSFATITPQVTATAAQPAAAGTSASTSVSSGPAGGNAGASGNTDNGKTIFQNGIGDPAVPACSTCHNADTPDVKIGPSLKGIASRAGSRVPGEDAATYIHTSIVQPNAFLVPNDDGHVYSAAGTSLMFQNYAQHLSDAQVSDLVAYLLTLK